MDRLTNETEEEMEDAKELCFPKEFQTARPLLNSEVFLLLEQRKKQNEASEGVSQKFCQNSLFSSDLRSTSLWLL